MKILIPILENKIQGIDTPYGRSLYEIERKTILQYVCEALSAVKDAELVFILHRVDVVKYKLDSVVKMLAPDAEIVVSRGDTSGAACSCMLAFDNFVMDEPLIIYNSGHIVTLNLQDVVNCFSQKNYDGGVIVFDGIHPRWSYVRLNENGFVIEAAEKRPISRNATSGFYYFKRAEDFVSAVFSMIKKEASVDGKYYICPAYNEMVLLGKKIGIYRINQEQYFNLNHRKGIELYEEYLRKRRVFNEIV
ncbi:MAG: glycosyltransferase family 2 protein [Treponema sp.]|nr:glycosyltransferase family 2 protein [Treponema sp.]